MYAFITNLNIVCTYCVQDSNAAGPMNMYYYYKDTTDTVVSLEVLVFTKGSTYDKSQHKYIHTQHAAVLNIL